MSAWTIVRLDGGQTAIVPRLNDDPAGDGRREGGWRDQMLNGVFPTKRAAIEADLAAAIEELRDARARVRRARARLRREVSRSAANPEPPLITNEPV